MAASKSVVVGIMVGGLVSLAVPEVCAQEAPAATPPPAPAPPTTATTDPPAAAAWPAAAPPPADPAQPTVRVAPTPAAPLLPPASGDAADAPPSKGTGLIIAGGILTGLGALNLATAPLCKIDDLIKDPDIQDVCLVASLVVGGAMLAVGVPLLVVGIGNRSDYKEWEERHKRSSFVVAPAVLPGGAGLGAAMRF
jgi:hypothetical protein